jgi:hypothetical protein
MRRASQAINDNDLRDTTAEWMIRASRLVELGIPESTVYSRCRQGGPWQRVLPGIIFLSNGQPTMRQLLSAALIYGGEGAMVTGLHACRQHGLRRGPSPSPDAVHVLVPSNRQPQTNQFVVIERTWRLPAPRFVGGLPCAPVPRACLDAARRIRDSRAVIELLADAVQRGFCTVGDLESELRQSARRGSAVPRAVLKDVASGVRSAAERDAKRLWERTGLPEPWWNARVFDSRGRLLGVVDAWWDEPALAWEIDSVEFHLSPADYARTTARAARFVAAGVVLVPTLPSRLRRDPAGVIGELQAAYRNAARRSRPRLRAVPAPR